MITNDLISFTIEKINTFLFSNNDNIEKAMI
jgi:hypothetical protein